MEKRKTVPSFRADINGLRAWAVIAVILYHFGVPGFSGGFIGVDIFFVISGFLMTSIVVNGLERGGSLWFFTMSFYLARARRILPALIVLCSVLLVLGWWVLIPLDYKMLSTHVVFSLAFLSNIKFWREAGYFDAASDEKWLLHTWSLSVEWQFYLLLPLVLLAVWKFHPGRRPVIAVMAVGLIVSLTLSIIGTSLEPTAAFYLVHTRAWAMFAGGLVYLLAERWALTARQRRWIEVVGLLFVLGAIFGIDTTSPWPGWRATIPVLGTVAVLLASRSESLWTGHTLAQWLGTRSYSLYIWHWPVVVALVYLELQSSPGAIFGGLAFTLLLGHLSYLCVENPARNQLAKLRMSWGISLLMGAVIAVAASGAAIRWQEGVPGRFSSAIVETNKESLNRNPRQAECHVGPGSGSPSCMFGGSNLRVIVMGDSHANAVVSAVATAAPKSDDGVMEWSFGGCPILEGVKSVRNVNWQCDASVTWTINKLKFVPKNVPLVIINRNEQYTRGQNEDITQANIPWIYFSRVYATSEPDFLKEYGQHLIDTTCEFAKDRTVYLVRPIPEMGIDVPRTARSMVWGHRKDVSISLVEYHQRHSATWAAQDSARDRCGIKILDPLPYLCRDGRCFGSKDGRPLYYDDDHLSEYGNKMLVPMFAEIFQ